MAGSSDGGAAPSLTAFDLADVAAGAPGIDAVDAVGGEPSRRNNVPQPSRPSGVVS